MVLLYGPIKIRSEGKHVLTGSRQNAQRMQDALARGQQMGLPQCPEVARSYESRAGRRSRVASLRAAESPDRVAEFLLNSFISVPVPFSTH
jgi:hypothetical protein